MITVSVSSLKSGERLTEEVRTLQGGLLIEKGKVLSQRDVEVLKAFMIKYVVVEAEGVTAKGEKVKGAPVSRFATNDASMFYKYYDGLYQLMKRAFHIISLGNDTLPILELRTQLDRILQLIHIYNPLTFTSRRPQQGQDDYLIHSGIMNGLTSYLLAKWQGLPQKDLVPIAIAGILHDIGTFRIDESIWNKSGKLSPEEYEEMKKHTVIGYNLLKNIAGLNDGVKLAALQHHERNDGSGYPLGLGKDKIHLYAKIVAVADVFHAMTTSRKHKKAASPYLVLEELMQEAFGRLEPALIQTFIQKLTQFHNGTIVRLNDGAVAEIVFTDRDHPTRPMVNVDGKIINLAAERDRFIQEVISN